MKNITKRAIVFWTIVVGVLSIVVGWVSGGLAIVVGWESGGLELNEELKYSNPLTLALIKTLRSVRVL